MPITDEMDKSVLTSNENIKWIFCVAIYWIRDDEYGSVSTFDSEEKAMEYYNWLKSPTMGYGRDDIDIPKNQVHCWKKPTGRIMLAT